MAKGYLSIVLHAHLPYVRHPEYPDFLEERWLFEAVIECYVPLLERLYRLSNDGIPFRMNVVLTPTLLHMLHDDLLRERFVRHLERLERLAEREERRLAGDETLHRLARFYRGRFATVHSFWDRWEGDLVHAFSELEARGHLEILTCAATHGFLPLLSQVPQAVRAQVHVGAAHHTHAIGRTPRGLWMPECGYYPGLDEVLAAEGIRFTLLDTHGLLNASVPPRYGVYAPVYAPSGVAAFARDPESSRQVWSADTGYPGDFVYRDFYRDIGFDLPIEELGDVAHPDGIQLFTGIKYHRITHARGLENKDLYNPSLALEKAAEHAGNFLFNRQHQVEHLASVMDRPPVVVSPYDAELYGHWWFEGPDFIEMLMRKLHHDQDVIATATLPQVLRSHPRNQVVIPAASSWGAGGYSEVWLNGYNSWLLRHLTRASRDMVDLARRNPTPSGLTRRALNQAARELLLAQSSDWPFIMKTRQTVDFAVKHARVHLSRFRRLKRELDIGNVDSGWLADLEWRDNVFPHIDYEVYA